MEILADELVKALISGKMAVFGNPPPGVSLCDEERSFFIDLLKGSHTFDVGSWLTLDTPALDLLGVDMLTRGEFHLPYPVVTIQGRHRKGKIDRSVILAYETSKPERGWAFVTFSRTADKMWLVPLHQSLYCAVTDSLQVVLKTPEHLEPPDFCKNAEQIEMQRFAFVCALLAALRLDSSLSAGTQSPKEKMITKTGAWKGFSYAIVRLGNAAVQRRLGLDRPPTPERAGPRMHWRRAHTRRLKSGRFILVRHAIVGQPDAGIVEHDYALGGRRTGR